jgi:hypothetical protein
MGLFTRTLNVGFPVLIALIAITLTASVLADAPTAEVSKMFPVDLGGFRQTHPIEPITRLAKDGLQSEFFPTATETRAPTFVGGETEYVSSSGHEFLVELVRFQIDSEAYALLTLVSRKTGNGIEPTISVGDVGTATSRSTQSLSFFKGTTFVRVSSLNGEPADSTVELARVLAGTIDKGQDDLPVLVKHLPDWEKVQPRASYTVSLAGLRDVVPNQPVLDVINFEGGAEAAIASYGQAKLVILEFTTPQFSVDNDSRVWTRISELKTAGQPVPTAYRRVGNYSVFVFNAADDKTAHALIDQVKYEQVVQWLGDDPHLHEKLQRYFGQVSAGVLVAVLKSSGISILLCIAAGALIGAMLFRYRRTQKAAAYSDAGGSIRLNLDDLTQPVNTRRLLKSAEPPESRSANT